MPDFSRIASIFSPLSLILAIYLLHITFTMFGYGPWNFRLCTTFTMQGCWILSNDLSPFNKMVMFVVYFLIDYILYYVDAFPYWTIHESLRLSLLVLVGISFKCVLGFGLWVYYCVILHSHSQGKLVSTFLYYRVFLWFKYQCNCNFIERIG